MPGILLRCIVWGVLTGPLWCLLFTAIFNPRAALPFLASPKAVAMSSFLARVFHFLLPVLRTRKLLPYLLARRLFPGHRRTVFIAYNALACPLAFASAALVIAHLPETGVHIEIPYFWSVLIVEAAIGAVLAIVIGAFVKLRLEVERTQTETAKAQALALQSQINPHFFFNTLNSISALVDGDPAAAKRMIGRLSDMFRYTLGCTHTESVTLDQELRFVRDYLEIERARFPQRLSVELPREPLPAIQVPGLVLQPLVENAVKHGIAPLLEGGVVSIRVTQGGGTARISVRNTAAENGPIEPASFTGPDMPSKTCVPDFGCSPANRIP